MKKKTNIRVRRNGRAGAAVQQVKRKLSAFDREALAYMLNIHGRFTPSECRDLAEDLQFQVNQARRVAELLKEDADAWHLARNAAAVSDQGKSAGEESEAKSIEVSLRGPCGHTESIQMPVSLFTAWKARARELCVSPGKLLAHLIAADLADEAKSSLLKRTNGKGGVL